MDLSSQLPEGISHYTVDNVEGFGSLYPILLSLCRALWCILRAKMENLAG